MAYHLLLSALVATACASQPAPPDAKTLTKPDLETKTYETSHYNAHCEANAYEVGEDHGTDKVTLIHFHEQVIYQYQHYFFSKIPAQDLVDFIKEKSVQIVVDLREGASEKDLPDQYPAVYWAHPIGALAQLDLKNVDELEQHLETFSDKTILFVSSDGDSAVTSFTAYWANANSLNDKWIAHTATDLGLKDPNWLKKWSDLEKSSQEADEEPGEDRSSASEK